MHVGHAQFYILLLKFMKRDFKVGNLIHIYNRGNRKMPIVRDENDKWRFLKILRFFNDQNSSHNVFRQLNYIIKSGNRHFDWPKELEKQKPLVKILDYHLKKNHYHLATKEIIAGGTSKFMKKLGDGFTNYVNIKYEEVGSVFQGAYKAKVLIGDMRNIHYLDAYIQVFNAFEDYPGGIEKALQEFDKAFEFAMDNPFCSLGECFGRRNLGIIDRDILKDTYPNLEAYKEFARDALLVRNAREILGKLTME